MHPINYLLSSLSLWMCLIMILGTTRSSIVGPDGSTFKSVKNWSNLQIAAFVDLDADRHMDMVLVNEDGSKLFSVLQTSAKYEQRPTNAPFESITDPAEIRLAPLANPIRSVSTADFNGDSRADLLLISADDGESGPFLAYIAYGLGGNERGKFGPPLYVTTFKSQPMICDLNSDMIADLYGQTSASQCSIFFGGLPTFNSSVACGGGSTWSNLGYSAFGDIDGDRIPDLVTLVDHANRKQIQLTVRKNTGHSITETPSLIDLPSKLSNNAQLRLGLFLLGDFDSDGHIDLLLPACTTSTCLDSSYLFMYSFTQNKWSEVSIDWTPKGIDNPSESKWSFTPIQCPKGRCLLSSQLVGAAAADINLDGNIDLAMGLSEWRQNAVVQMHPAILINAGSSLSMAVHLLPGVNLPQNDVSVRQIGFFDVGEDGIFDLVVVSNTAEGTFYSQLFTQHMSIDSHYLKVMVLNGLCASDETCSDLRLPYGLTVPGESLLIDWETATGSRHRQVALLGCQSCCSALQLQFQIFGLGTFANYVEQLDVSISSLSNLVRSRLLKFLAPKSQIIVNTYPHDNPEQWTTKLFLKPFDDLKVVYIAITLVSICILLIIIIGILQWLEIREDRLEKQKETQRFHFDAM